MENFGLYDDEMEAGAEEDDGPREERESQEQPDPAEESRPLTGPPEEESAS